MPSLVEIMEVAIGVVETGNIHTQRKLKRQIMKLIHMKKGDMKTMNRNLDGYYFRVKRGDRWENVCFSDLTQEEKEFMLAGRSEEWLKSLCCGVADALREIGDELDIVCG